MEKTSVSAWARRLRQGGVEGFLRTRNEYLELCHETMRDGRLVKHNGCINNEHSP